jgi:RNA polymerase sigma-70 factor (ECF subfamily)
MNEARLQVLVEQLRRGDEAAAEELVRFYEPQVRRAIRVRLRNRHLRRLLETSDVCQSVLKSFFMQVARGQDHIHDPTRLRQLLMAMARKKLVSYARHHTAAKRDVRRQVSLADCLEALTARDQGPSPLDVVALRDLLSTVRGHFTDEEWTLINLRADGQTWREIAACIGSTEDAVRMKVCRAVERVRNEIALSGDDRE